MSYWRSGNGGVCTVSTNGLLIDNRVASCNTISAGSFAGANGAVFLGEFSSREGVVLIS